MIIISQEYAWIPHPRTRECGAQTSILVHTIPWNVSNIFGPTGHPAPPLSPAVAEYCGVARGQQASAGNRISAASSRKRKHSVALVSAEAQHTSLGVRANLLHPVTQYSGTDTVHRATPTSSGGSRVLGIFTAQPGLLYRPCFIRQSARIPVSCAQPVNLQCNAMQCNAVLSYPIKALAHDPIWCFISF